MPREPENLKEITLDEAVRKYPDWAKSRIVFLEHVLKTMSTLIQSGLFALESIDSAKFTPREDKSHVENDFEEHFHLGNSRDNRCSGAQSARQAGTRSEAQKEGEQRG